MKNKSLKIICIILVLAGFLYLFFISSVLDLTNVKDVCEVRVSEAGELLTVENSINGIIPTGKDYYYVCRAADANVLYPVSTGKNWLNDYFTAEGTAKDGSLLIKGLAKRASDFQVEMEITSRMGEITGSEEQNSLEQALTPGYVLELNYVRDSVIRIIAGVLVLAVGAVLFFFKKMREKFPAWAGKAILVLCVCVLFFALWAL